MQDFEKDCQRQVDNIAAELQRRYEGNADEIEELETQLEELEDNEPEEPDQEEDETDEAYDKKYAEYEKEFKNWEDEVDSLNEKIDELKDEGDLRSYFDDYLDVDYIVNSNKEYQSARIWVTIGGPGIYIDTEKATVELRWGGTSTSAPISYNVRDEIDSIFEEYYDIS